MKQGEIWDINLNPTLGNEQSGIRPAVIISGDVMNNHYSLVIVCPITPKVKNLRGNVILLPSSGNGLKTKSEILVFHVRAVSKERLIHRRGAISKELINQIKSNLNKVLDY